MKDKEKFRAEIEKMFNEALNRAKVTGGDEYWTGKADAYRNTLTSLDSMQKEPEYSVGNIIFKNDKEEPLIKKTFPDGRVTTGFLRINFDDGNRREYDEVPVSEDMLKELKRIVNVRELEIQGIPVITIARHFAKCGKEHQEVVSDDIEESSQEYISKVLKRTYMLIGKQALGEEVDAAYKAGAQWQMKQIEKDYADISRGIISAKGFAVSMAYEKGMADMKKQMMNEAVEGTVQTYLPFESIRFIGTPLHELGLKTNNPVKVIIVKEDLI